MNEIAANAIANLVVNVCSAAIIGCFAYVFRDKFFNYISDARLMKNIGITKLRNNSRFSSSELHQIFKNASVIRVYYKTGERFWKRLEQEKVLQKIKHQNPNLKVKVIIANQLSKQSTSMCEAERMYGTRKESENNISTEVEIVSKLLDKYEENIQYVTDPDLFFLPYMIVEYTKNNISKRVCYLGLNIIPVRSPNSLQIVSEILIHNDNSSIVNQEWFDDDAINNAKLVEQLSVHFDTAWKMALLETIE